MEAAISSRHGSRITNLDDWRRSASTKGKWADDFSAKELARLWLAGVGPAALTELLAPALPGFRVTHAVAEERVAFDPYSGGVRNHDVLAFAQAESGPVVVGVEGKVNESLDATVLGKYRAASARKKNNLSTFLDRRVDELLQAFAGRQLEDDPALGGLRYQLFSGIAGTLAAATADTKAAAFVIHLIRSPLAKQDKLDATRAAVEQLLDVVFGRSFDGTLSGPVHLHAGTALMPGSLPLWIGVVETPSLPQPSP